MVGRRTLITLAVAAVVLLVIAFATGGGHHGLRHTVNVITFNGFLLCLVVMIVLGVVALVRGRQPRAR
jgi:uncharacterized membrane protein